MVDKRVYRRHAVRPKGVGLWRGSARCSGRLGSAAQKKVRDRLVLAKEDGDLSATDRIERGLCCEATLCRAHTRGRAGAAQRVGAQRAETGSDSEERTQVQGAGGSTAWGAVAAAPVTEQGRKPWSHSGRLGSAAAISSAALLGSAAALHRPSGSGSRAGGRWPVPPADPRPSLQLLASRLRGKGSSSSSGMAGGAGRISCRGAAPPPRPLPAWVGNGCRNADVQRHRVHCKVTLREGGRAEGGKQIRIHQKDGEGAFWRQGRAMHGSSGGRWPPKHTFYRPLLHCCRACSPAIR